ncbi:kelch repeat protein [Myriangium duriaei CBS 260.36]|uniref:Kelch repeat protein n=1 Tax=Myriangium duriaei CBS 260.36 TaxID=1168546 RepID=A0A9P4J9C5_9PEZI|nr:kelch repeat protein [Myriangium duriaei CBS 260.36]
MKATWTKIAQASALQRSSHTVSSISNKIYVFGGELLPRKPRDNDLHTLEPDLNTLNPSGSKPSPRVGSATTTLDGKLFLFSGRGGEHMAPVDEQGGLHQYDPAQNAWTLLRPSGDSFPQARSYHSMASDGQDTIFVHAGCPEKGRLSDLWAYSLASSTWKQLHNAPDPARGGTSIAFADGKLYRMNGFDGQTEQGGSLDVYDPVQDSWSTINYKADGASGPGPRSVSVLVPVHIEGKTFLVTMFGESDPSSLGHMGAGKMLNDVWIFSLDEHAWSKIDINGGSPAPRGWFDADALHLHGRPAIAVGGGLDASNERLDDFCVLSF